jgi:hypothetical protein
MKKHWLPVPTYCLIFAYIYLACRVATCWQAVLIAVNEAGEYLRRPSHDSSSSRRPAFVRSFKGSGIRLMFLSCSHEL